MQKQNNADFDLQVKAMCEAAQEPAPAGAWGAISSRLAAAGAAAPARRVWGWAAASLALAASVVLALVLFPLADKHAASTPERYLSQVVEAPAVSENAPDASESAPAAPASSKGAPSAAYAAPSAVKAVPASSDRSAASSENAASVAAASGNSAEVSGSTVGIKEAPAAAASGTSAATKEAPAAIKETPAAVQEAPATAHEAPSESKEVAAATAPSATKAAPAETKDTPAATKLAPAETDPFAAMAAEDARKSRQRRTATLYAGGSLASNNASEGTVAYAASGLHTGKGISETSKSTYGLPLSIGAGIRIGLTDRLSISTGLDYSLLTRSFSANYTDGAGTIAADVRHTLQYIGVPLNLHCRILDIEGLRLYAFAGGEAEYGFSNKYTVHAPDRDIRVKGDTGGLQYSAAAGLGVEFRISDRLGIYLDPSARYYFDCRQPKSIRTEKPFLLVFDAGLRFNL